MGVLSFASCSPSHRESGPDYKAAMKVAYDLGLVRDWASIAADTVERSFR